MQKLKTFEKWDYLAKLRGKKDKQIQTNQKFWTWFADHEKAFHHVIKSRGDIERDFFNPIADKLNALRPGYLFLAGMLTDDTAELVLTVDGVVKNIAFVENLVNDAPAIKGWKFTALKTIFGIIEAFIEEFLNEIFFFENTDVKSKFLVKYKFVISQSINFSSRINIEEYKKTHLEKLQYSVSDKKLLLEHPEDIKDLIYKSEKNIISSNPDYILKFLKSSDFIKRQYEVIEKSIFILKNEDDKETIDEWADAISKQIGIYNISYLNCVAMISSLVSNRLKTSMNYFMNLKV